MLSFDNGSTVFSPISSFIGITIDQFNFIICQIFAFAFGFIFSRYFSVEKVRPVKRHILEIVVGVFLTLFCFGSQIWYLLAQSFSVYVMMKLLPVKLARYFILAFVLFFLSIAHISRMYYDYGFYSLGITGPLMIQTQKLSSLAFNLSDGQKVKKGQILRKEDHKKHAIERYPTLLEFFSYIFYFHGVMVGPFVFLADYLRFIEGRQAESLSDGNQIDEFNKHRLNILGAWREIAFHSVSLVIYAILYYGVQQYFDPEYLLSDEYLNFGFLKRYFIMTITMFLVRQRYYLAWTTGSITNLVAGLGFSGFDNNFRPQYHIVKNFHFTQTEIGNNTKVMIDHWNVCTVLWLRECIYDRMPMNIGMITVFTCSAIWHGFYSGYYLTFATVLLVTTAGRYGRKMLRPLAIDYNYKWSYDILTTVVSMFSLNFCLLPFILLEITKGLIVWKSLYFIGPVCWLAVIVVGKFHGQTKIKENNAK